MVFDFNADHGWTARPQGYMRVLLVHLEIYKAHLFQVALANIDGLPAFLDPVVRQSWNTLWSATTNVLTSLTWIRLDETSRELSLRCLALLSVLQDRKRELVATSSLAGELDDDPRGSTSRLRSAYEDLFPNELYATLIAFVPQGYAARHTDHVQNRGATRTDFPLKLI